VKDSASSSYNNSLSYSGLPQMKFIIYMYRVSQEECARLQEGVPYVKVYQYNPKHLCPKLNGYGSVVYCIWGKLQVKQQNCSSLC
jgi:hypothetical protein